MIWSFLPFWPNSIYWKRQGLVRRLDCKQFPFFSSDSVRGFPPRSRASRAFSHARGYLRASCVSLDGLRKKSDCSKSIRRLTGTRPNVCKRKKTEECRTQSFGRRVSVKCLSAKSMSDILYFRWPYCSVYNVSDRPSYSWNSSALHCLENIIKNLWSFSPSAGWEKTKTKITLFPIFRSDLEPVCAWVSELR